MMAEIIVGVLACTRKTSEHGPVTTTYFTFVSNDLYQAHRLPAGWVLQGQKPSGVPHQKLVTMELPDYIHDVGSGFGTHYISEYSTQDGNANKVFIYCDAIPVLDGFEPAIDAAIQTIKISTPTPSGKREDLPAKVFPISELY